MNWREFTLRCYEIHKESDGHELGEVRVVSDGGLDYRVAKIELDGNGHVYIFPGALPRAKDRRKL